MTRSSVNASAKIWWPTSPVRLRIGATATAIFGSRQSHRGFSAAAAKAPDSRTLRLSSDRRAVTETIIGVRVPAAWAPATGSSTLPRRAISSASACVSASGVTPSSRCNVSMQLLYCLSPPGLRVGADQRSLPNLGKRVERHQPASGLNGGIVVPGCTLRRC